jgi:hypothetical protein
MISFHRLVKWTVSVLEKDLYPHSRDALLQVLGRVEPLRIASVDGQRLVKAPPHARPDLIVDAHIGGEDWLLLIECKAVAHPQSVRSALFQLKSYLEGLPGPEHRYGILMAPFLSRASAKLCEEAGVGYIDLAGNSRLTFGPVYIETRSAENPFRERRADRPLFTPKAGRVLRVLLTPPLRSWKVAELAEAAAVSLGHVSAVRRNLLAREWAEASEAGLRLTRPEQLLKSWQPAYKAEMERERQGYTLLHGCALEEAVKSAMAEAGGGAHLVYASYSAGKWLAPYARNATQFFYADREGAEALELRLALEPSTRGANVVIWQPRENDVFSGRVEAGPGVWCTGLVQTWLDLCAAGDRGQEAADHLLERVLQPAWREDGQ